MSPFTLIFENSGFKYAASIMNVVVLTAIISAANASMYTASRVLWHMGSVKEAPKIFNCLSLNGVPVIAVATSGLFCGIFAITSFFGSGVIFNWLINVISLAGYIAWFGICLSHYRFRKSYLLQGKCLDLLPYKAKWSPFAPIFAMTLIILIMIGQEVMAVIEGQATLSHFFAVYSGSIGFILLYLGYKIFKKTKIVPLSECELELK